MSDAISVAYMEGFNDGQQKADEELKAEVERLTSILVEATNWATRHNYVEEVYALEQILRQGKEGE